MSVLSAVAFLNNSDEQLDTQRSPSPASPNKKPTTEAAIKELNRIRTGGGNGVVSLMSKFGSDTNLARPAPPPPPQRSTTQQQLASLRPIPATANVISKTNTSRSPVNNNDQHHIKQQCSPQSPTRPKVVPATTTTTTIATAKSSSSSPSPPPRTTTRNAPTGMTRTSVDMLSEELTALYQESVAKAEAAEQELKTLKSEVATYEVDSTKVRDYEIRVEYLAQKLEQVSEERDGLEQELRMYRERQGSLDTPVSPVFQHRLSGIFNQDKQQQEQQDHLLDDYHNNNPDINDHQEDDIDENSEFMHDILDAYEDDEDENSSFGVQSEHRSEAHLQERSVRGGKDSSSVDQHQQIALLTEQLRAADQGTKIAVQHYLSELEQERLRTKTMQQMLKKQEDLIATLESKLVVSSTTTVLSPKVSPRPPRNASLASPTRENVNINNSSSSERALREQVESQRAELEDKRALLTQLLNEREDMLKKVKLGASRPGASSFDILAELARPTINTTTTTTTAGDHHHHHHPQQRQSPIVDGRNTPPPSAPPREPLPPLPAATSTASPSKSSARGSLGSFHEGSGVSSVTSWSSSTDYYGRPKKEQPEQPSMTHNNFEAMYSNYLKDDLYEEDPHDHYLEALRRIEGPNSPSDDNNTTSTWNPNVGNKMTAH
ncbi:hypothetical protein BDB00DRAFT_573135 [Zychaea mexicana]|uniref:uncharacterized protein n=1 Tax=Zychaea mexicana TaxID=64656 RepID=UPI0022FDFD44|nr:uncharacterized protein BDB00DRAFT_573135 [Zychaea mexicana]KAI9489932.1 hypothetical protein BDB00DRAFT_573135 [Zychaea mexicana]